MPSPKLTDSQWRSICELLPGVEGNAGANGRNNRLFIDAILYRYRWKSSWRELPEEFGDWKNVHRRCIRWAKAGVWEKVFARLVAEADDKVVEERHNNAQKMTPEDRAELVHKIARSITGRAPFNMDRAGASGNRESEIITDIFDLPFDIEEMPGYR